MITLCKNLRLEIGLDPQAREVRVKLTDPLSMREAELGYAINATTPESEGYHIKESIVIAVRRLIGAAVKAELIDIPTRMPGSDTVVMAAKLTPRTISSFKDPPGAITPNLDL